MIDRCNTMLSGFPVCAGKSPCADIGQLDLQLAIECVAEVVNSDHCRRNRDVARSKESKAQRVPFLVQLGLFLSPVAYTSSLIPEPWRPLYGLNPMSGAIEGFRWALFGGARPDSMILEAGIVSALMLLGALVYFRRAERTFADEI